MKSVHLKLTAEDGTEVGKIRGDFSDVDIGLLRNYARQLDRISDATLFVKGIPFITNMHWQAGSMMRFSCPAFTNQELHELLHVLRPVILSREPASFNNVMSLLGRAFQDKAFATHQKYIRHIFDDGELSMYMQVSLNDQKLLDDYLLRIWLNGTQYHTEQDKADAWTTLELALTAENAPAIVISQLNSRVKALFLLMADVALVIGQVGNDTEITL